MRMVSASDDTSTHGGAAGPSGGDPLTFLLDLAQRVERHGRPEPALGALVEGLARLQGWDVAEAWVLESDGLTIVPGACWVRSADLAAFAGHAATAGYQPDRGIVRRAWTAREPAWFTELSTVPELDFPRREAALHLGLRSGALVPVAAGGHTVAVLSFFARAARGPDAEALRLARAAAAQVAWLLEHRIQERRLGDTLRRFELLSGNARDIVSLHAPDGSYRWVSRSVRDILGYGPDELVGRSPLDLVHPDDRGRAVGRVRELLAGDDRRLPRYRYRRKNGGYVWLESAARAVRDEATGEPSGLVVSSRDVDEHERDRRALGDSQRMFRQLFADNPLPMWVYDTRDLAILEVNEAALAQYGYDREAFLAKTILDIRPVEDRDAVVDLVGRERPPLNRAGTWRHLHADGSLLEVEIDSHATTFAGRPARLVVARDVGERRRLERERERRGAELASLAAEKESLLQRLREQARGLERRVEARTAELRTVNRELEGFTYSVSHDLRTPLRAIDGFSAALLEDYADRLDGRGRHYLERVRGAAQHMGALIDDLLTLSRIGRAALEPRDLDLADIAREVEAELRGADPGRAVTLAIPPSLPAHGDRTLLRLVLQNLIGNAWKFTARNVDARIEVSGERADGGMTYTVSDNGAGFDMRYVGKLFRPFQRLHGADEYPGTGVGLANVQRIVQRHGGRVWAEAEVGRGAAFHFTLGEGRA